jgi:hypothetical protein
VLLDGGINMLVEGLLTYQVVDVEKLINEIGDRDLLRVITDVTKVRVCYHCGRVCIYKVCATCCL